MPICKICGDEFTVINTQQRRQRTTCSHECATVARSEAGRSGGCGRGDEVMDDLEMARRMFIVRHNLEIESRKKKGSLIPMDW